MTFERLLAVPHKATCDFYCNTMLSAITAGNSTSAHADAETKSISANKYRILFLMSVFLEEFRQ